MHLLGGAIFKSSVKFEGQLDSGGEGTLLRFFDPPTIYLPTAQTLPDLHVLELSEDLVGAADS